MSSPNDLHLYLAPAPGDTVTVRLDEQMVRDMRAYNDDDPAATNHELADRVQALLTAGQRTLRGVCEHSSTLRNDSGGEDRRVMEAHQLVRVRCLQLSRDELLVFCAADCELECVSSVDAQG